MKNKSIKLFYLIGLMVIIFPLTISAKRGCCSHHGGVAGCHSSGKQLCNDGTLSPSCTCTPQVIYIYGCTDSDAKNYNPRANKNDDTCEYYIYGCMDEDAKNYNPDAEKEDDSCEYYKYGCTDKKAINYDETAEKDDNSCEYKTISQETSKEPQTESTHEDSSGISSLLTLGGIGTAVYYIKKKK